MQEIVLLSQLALLVKCYLKSQIMEISKNSLNPYYVKLYQIETKRTLLGSPWPKTLFKELIVS
jgi:hypothetical protein